MAYATQSTWTEWKGGKWFTRSCAKLLRGQKIFRGALCYQHNGRAVAAERPTGSLLAAGVNGGGPLLFAGADANGGVYVWARREGVRFAIVNGGSAAYNITEGNTLDLTLTAPVASVTGAVALQLLLAHPVFRDALGFVKQGTGAGLIAATALTAPPVITVLGIASEDADNSADASNDADLPVNAQEFKYGEPWLVNDSDLPISVTGGLVQVLDDLTVTRGYKISRQELLCTDLDSRLGVCVRIP